MLVLGISTNLNSPGTLKPAKIDLQCLRKSSLDTLAPSLSSIKAHGVSPHFSSGLATTPTATTSGCL